ncbi:MAG: DJ-1/PfpI family protein [Candidatus Woesearchaeota archaeon]
MREKIYLVIAQEGFRDEELLEPLDVFKPTPYEPVILSPKQGTCKGMFGAEVESDKAIKDAVIDDDTRAIIIIGGKNSPNLIEHKELGTLLYEAKENKLIIGAICLGPMVLASFNMLDGRHATVYETEESKAMFNEHNVTYIKEDVIVDNNIVTANGPHAATAFAENIVDILGEQNDLATNDDNGEEE